MLRTVASAGITVASAGITVASAGILAAGARRVLALIVVDLLAIHSLRKTAFSAVNPVFPTQRWKNFQTQRNTPLAFFAPAASLVALFGPHHLPRGFFYLLITLLVTGCGLKRPNLPKPDVAEAGERESLPGTYSDSMRTVLIAIVPQGGGTINFDLKSNR
jgi:hypothetical protein